MSYSINEAAAKFHLSVHTLRFYDKEGLMPFLGRDKTGNRVFTEEDLNWVAMICCLKKTGMPLKAIKQYADWCVRGKQTIGERKAMLVTHRDQVVRQMEELNSHLQLIDSKIHVYDNPELYDKLYGHIEKER